MTLYIVSTPIGNLADISPRALDCLRSVHTILAEDTRHTRKLLSHYDIHTPLLSYHQHSKITRLDEILSLLKMYDLALVSDAGTPGISDPGAPLIAAAIAQNVPVNAIPGASAVTTALTISGFQIDQFLFLGFLPRRKSRQQALVKDAMSRRCPLVFYESPFRLESTLVNLREIIGSKSVMVARELTKQFESTLRGNVDSVIEQVKSMPKKGEIVVVMEG